VRGKAGDKKKAGGGGGKKKRQSLLFLMEKLCTNFGFFSIPPGILKTSVFLAVVLRTLGKKKKAFEEITLGTD